MMISNHIHRGQKAVEITNLINQKEETEKKVKIEVECVVGYSNVATYTSHDFSSIVSQ